MLKSALIHPELIHLLASCGHGDKVLIADGNYPLSTNVGEQTSCIFLNLTPGIPSATEVLQVLQQTFAIQKADVMLPEDQAEPQIFTEFRNILDNNVEFCMLARQAFYDSCKEKQVRVAIATGERRVFGNILLTVGVV